MESTTDYNMFKDYSSNREVDDRHVRKLVREIQKRNLLSVNPILVDKDFRIIDGQHRLEAAKILKVPIYYMLGDVNRDDISRINSCQKNWSLMDYLNYYTIEGKKTYMLLSGLINHYPKIKHSALVALSNPNFTRHSEEIKSGYLNTDNIDFAHEVCKVVMQLHEQYLYEFVLDSKFPIALGIAMKNEKFSLEYMLEKIAASPRSFVRCHSIKDYRAMMSDVYNFKVSKSLIKL